MKQLNLTNRTLAAPMNLHRGPTARFHISTRKASMKTGSAVGTAYGGTACHGNSMVSQFTTGMNKGSFKFNTGF